MINKRIMVFFVFCFNVISICPGICGNEIHVHNSSQEIDKTKSKLQMKLIRLWGGDEEDDINKFFRTPVDTSIAKDGLIYICDSESHQIQVFDQLGKFQQTIGRRGRGPGDLLMPTSMAIDNDGNLIVSELMGNRIQILSPKGKYINSFKLNTFPDSIHLTSTGEIVVYSPQKTDQSGTLLSVYTYGGKLEKEIGKCRPRSGAVSAEQIVFALDKSNNFYIANLITPVIRKYANNGRFLKAMTYEMPPDFEVPQVSINAAGDDIKIMRKKRRASIKKTGRRIQYSGDRVVPVANAIAVDCQKKIFLAVRARKMTKKERKNSGIIMAGAGNIIRKDQDIDVFNDIDLLRLLVFDRSGKVIASSMLDSLCDSMYIIDNRLFIIDGYKTKRILEYEISLN